MKTKQGGIAVDETERPTAIESVKFRDGMIVTAEDLDAAQRYPVSLLRTVLRAYLGCGVVCGLCLRAKKTDAKPNWVICVDRGVAIDCHGYPLELCAPVELDLSPDPCACDDPPTKVFIAIRRITSDEVSEDPCSCDVDAPRFDCRRVRDHVVIKVFTKDELGALPPGSVCQQQTPHKSAGCGCGRTQTDQQEGEKTDQKDEKDSPPWAMDLCAALTGCSSCSCGDCWVLLGSVNLTKEEGVSKVNSAGRRWVKPIEAICPRLTDKIIDLEAEVNDQRKKITDQEKLLDDLQDLGGRFKKLEEQMGRLPGPVGQNSPATP